MKHVNSMHTLHTIMTNLATFRVHIAPLGFEIDRIILPPKADKGRQAMFDCS